MSKLAFLKGVFVSITSATCLIIGTLEEAQASTLTFDELFALGGQPIHSGYGGLSWDNFWVRQQGNNFNGVGPGFDNGTISTANVAYNGYADPAGISINNGTFTFNSVYLTAGSIDDLTITVKGFLDQTELFSQTLIVDKDSPTLATFNWSGVNRVRFASSGTGGYTHFAMDNLTLNAPTTAIPTPALLPGLIGLGFGAWRRRKAEASEKVEV